MSKVVLVTGGATGIGAATVKEFAKRKYDVIICYNSSEEKANDLLNDILNEGIKAIKVKCDISNEDEIVSMVETIKKTFDGVDILVNNAAIDINDFYYNKKTEDFKKTFDVNVIGSFLLSKYLSKYMINNKWGRIINISSTNGINTYYPVCLEYDASKAALISLTHNMAIQFAPYINVNAIAPGFIGTENELDGMDEEFIKEEEKKILVNRYGKPEEVAKLICYLASDDAAFINNSIIRIDGGQYGSN